MMILWSRNYISLFIFLLLIFSSPITVLGNNQAYLTQYANNDTKKATIKSYYQTTGIGAQGPIYVTDPQIKAASQAMIKRQGLPQQFGKYKSNKSGRPISAKARYVTISDTAPENRPERRRQSFSDLVIQRNPHLVNPQY